MFVAELGGARKHFDAFVCYTAADATFVHEMIYNLEHIRGVKLFIKERDMVAGGADYVMLAEIIKSRYIGLLQNNTSLSSLDQG